MKFPTSIIAGFSLLTAALANTEFVNTVTFVSQDGLNRTIYTTPGTAQKGIPPRILAGYSSEVLQIYPGWHGNMYTVIDGEKNTPGMLAEFTMNSDWFGQNFFDLSAIVNPLDVNNVKMIMPKASHFPFSGCQNYPACDNSYNWAYDDLHTCGSFEKDYIVLVGNLATTTRSQSQDASIPPQ